MPDLATASLVIGGLPSAARRSSPPAANAQPDPAATAPADEAAEVRPVAARADAASRPARSVSRFSAAAFPPRKRTFVAQAAAYQNTMHDRARPPGPCSMHAREGKRAARRSRPHDVCNAQSEPEDYRSFGPSAGMEALRPTAVSWGHGVDRRTECIVRQGNSRINRTIGDRATRHGRQGLPAERGGDAVPSTQVADSCGRCWILNPAGENQAKGVTTSPVHRA